ncbi:MAG TPA: PIN domain-containing protein [Bacteroides sp.]|nr:PIN domain-containing protein [Bacteroides sp.]
MTNIFIDTDVIIDFLKDRKPFSDDSTKMFNLIGQNKINGCVSSLCFSNLYYLLSKSAPHKRVIFDLNDLSQRLEILNVDKNIVKSALASDFKDFEDAIQYFTAREHGKINIIITRNIKDYKNSSLPVMTPETFLKTFEQIVK